MIDEDLFVFEKGIYRSDGEAVADRIFFKNHPSTQNYTMPSDLKEESWQEAMDIGWEHYHPRGEEPFLY